MVVIVIVVGGMVLFYVNDSGFWLVKFYFGFSEKEIFCFWIVLIVVLGGVGFGIVVLFFYLF